MVNKIVVSNRTLKVIEWIWYVFCLLSAAMLRDEYHINFLIYIVLTYLVLLIGDKFINKLVKVKE